MTGQPVQGHKSAWHCIECGADFFEPMTSAGYPTCPKCFHANVTETIARPNHVFVKLDKRTGEILQEGKTRS